MPESEGHAYIFTMVDRWSRWPEAIPVKDIAATTCADALIRGWIARFGVPSNLTSDRGAQFTSALWAELGKTLAIKNINTTAYHPQANGLVERFHRTLKASLMATGEPAGWMGRLPHVLLGIRTAQKEDTGFSPAEIVYGADLVLPGQLSRTSEPATSPKALQDYTLRLKADMAAAKYPETVWHTTAPRQQIPEALRSATFVFTRHGARRTPLTRPYDGPFRVLERGEKFFRIKVGTKEQVVTVDRLKPAFGFADPTPQSTEKRKEVKSAIPKKKIKRSLNPEAEIFIPSSRPKEKPSTMSRSRFGRTLRPPKNWE